MPSWGTRSLLPVGQGWAGLQGLAGRDQERLTSSQDALPPPPTGQRPTWCPLGLRPPYLLDFQRPRALLQSVTEAGEARGLQEALPEAERGQRTGQGIREDPSAAPGLSSSPSPPPPPPLGCRIPPLQDTLFTPSVPYSLIPTTQTVTVKAPSFPWLPHCNSPCLSPGHHCHLPRPL